MFGTLPPSSQKTTCSFPYRFSGKPQKFGPCTRQSGSQQEPIKFFVLGGGGGVLAFFRGGGGAGGAWRKCQFYFYWRRDCSDWWKPPFSALRLGGAQKHTSKISRNLYIYIWLVPRHLPTFLGSKPIYHPRLAQKKAFFFYTQICAKKKTGFWPCTWKKRFLTPISQRFFKNKTQNPLFYSVLAQNVTLPLVMSIMSLMFWVSVSKKCLKRW